MNAIVNPLTEEKRGLLTRAVNADGRAMYFPTHVVERDGEIIGGLSLGAVPVVLVWLDSHKATVFDMHRTMEQSSAIMRSQGFQTVAIPAWPCCPLQKYGKRVANLVGENVTIYYKDLYGTVR